MFFVNKVLPLRRKYTLAGGVLQPLQCCKPMKK